MSLALVLGCRGQEDVGERLQRQSGAPVEVDLPPVPALDTQRMIQHPDGSFSIWGLMQRREELIGQAVRVTGVVTDRYVCPYRAQQDAHDRMIELGERYVPEGTGLPEMPPERCNFPHLYIADLATSDQPLLVTGYEAVLEPQIQIGERYLFEGRFVEEARGFNRAGVGLIWVDQITGGTIGMEPPPEGEQPVIID